MTTKFSMTRDINGFNGFGLVASDINASAYLTANADTTFTVPGDVSLGSAVITNKTSWIVIFSFDPGASVWVAINTTATTPAGNSFGTTQSFLNPASIQVNAADVIHCVTTGTNIGVGLQFYSLS